MARKTSTPRGGFFTGGQSVPEAPTSLRGGFFHPKENPAGPEAPSDLLTRALHSLLGEGKDQPNDTLPPARVTPAISEGYGVGRPNGAAAAQITALSYEEVTNEDGSPDREYYDDIQVTDDAGMVFVFRPIKKAKFTGSVGTLELNFALPAVEDFLIDELPQGNME